MIIKNRTKSTELLMMTTLNNRMALSEKDKLHYWNLKKGFEGEVMFDGYLERVTCECLILNDLLFKMNQTTFQIDSLMITSNSIYVFEVKNYEGDYYYDSAKDKIFPRNRDVDIVNPLTQIMRIETLLQQLLQSLGFTGLRIHSYVVFVNPHFTLYQAPLDKPIIFPTQIQRTLDHLNKIQSRITNKSRTLAEKLTSVHMLESEYSQVPSYELEQLRKGLSCARCDSLMVVVEGRNCVCMGCGYTESVTSAVIRSVREFRMLFPGEKVTTGRIYEWCGGVGSMKTIRSLRR